MTESKPTANILKKPWRRLLYVLVACLLLLLLLLSSLSFVLSTQKGSEWALTRAVDVLNSSGEMRIEVENTQGTIFRGLSFGRIGVVHESAVVVINDLRTSWNPYSLLSGKLVLSDLWISRVRVEIQATESAESTSGAITFENPLPIGISLARLRVERIELEQQGEETVARSIALAAELDNSALEVTGLEFAALDVDVAGELTVEFSEPLALSALLSWRYSLATENTVEELAGRLELSGTLAELDISHQLESPQRILSSGRVVTGLEGGGFGFDLEHSAAAMILPVTIPGDYELTEVALTTQGSFEQLALSLQADLLYDRFPVVRIDADATYADSVLDVQSYTLDESENSVGGAVVIDWSDVINIVGNYTLQLPSVASFLDLPESIALVNLGAAGSYEIALPDGGAEGRLTVEEFSGQLAEYPLQGQGALFFRQGSLDIEGLQLQTQNNQLRVDGSYADNLDFNWTLSANSLDEFLIGGAGRLEGQGNLSGDPAAPDIVGQLSGIGLSYQNFQADVVDFDFQRVGGQLQSELAIDSLTYSDASITETFSPVVLLISGTESSHNIELNSKSRFGDLLAQVSGSINDLQNISWQGSLDNATVDTPLGSWTTRSTSDLSLADGLAELSESCWTQISSTLCFALAQTPAAGLTANGSLQGYPLSVFNSGQLLNAGAGPNLVQDQLLFLPQLPLGSTVEGMAGGRFSLSLLSNEDLAFDFSLVASDALLSIVPEQLGTPESFNEDVPPQEYSLEMLELSGDLQSAVWLLQADANILRENLDDTEIDARGEIAARVEIAADSSLSGSVEAGLADLRWLQALVPELSEIEGTLDARASLSGNLDAPAATGSIDLRDASVSLSRLGIALSAINANISSEHAGAIQVVGRAQSEAGFIAFNGEVLDPFGGSPTLSATLEGADFQLVNVPKLQLVVSPDVVLNVDASSIEINGSLHVPTLQLVLEELPETAIDVSRDVVIVDYPADRPDLARSIAATEATAFDIPLAGAIELTLGDDVTFTGFGMDTKLAGNLNIQQTASGSNRTYGELSIVEGSYEMYQQSLNINRGKFLFFGAYDNPGIDLRATREVEGFTVGVLMNGTLKNINSQLFSTPALADNDIIAVLVTGRPFSQMGQQDGDGDAVLTAIAKLGVGRSEGLTNQVRNKLGLDVLSVDPTNDINNSVLTIGKYLTPDIFIRYGVGLFDSQSKVAVDYTLSEHVKLQAESGEYQSVDIIYSVER